MLELKELHSYYGASHILHGIDLEVKKVKWSFFLAEMGWGKQRPFIRLLVLLEKNKAEFFLRVKISLGLKVIKLRKRALGLYRRGDGFSLAYRLQKI